MEAEVPHAESLKRRPIRPDHIGIDRFGCRNKVARYLTSVRKRAL
jgi:hypothetical protein